MTEPEAAAGIITEAQLQGFLNMFDPEVADVARQGRAVLERHIPGVQVLVYLA